MDYQFNYGKNYIKHNTPSSIPSFIKWKKYYESELDDMYCIVIDNMKLYFPNIDLINDDYFNLFCKMIYDSSSKYIDK